MDHRQQEFYDDDSDISDNSDVSTDEELVAIGFKKQNGLNNLEYDPKMNMSDHPLSDDEPSKKGYSHFDTDESDNEETLPDSSKLWMQLDQWCRCNKCTVMETEKECNCCQDCGAAGEILAESDEAQCITECQKFKDFAENINVLELLAYAGSSEKLARDKNGKVLDEGLRYACYCSYLHMLKIYRTGKGNRIPLPSCVVSRIKELYPSPSGIYKGFEEAMQTYG